jgi:hypothetical protein
LFVVARGFDLDQLPDGRGHLVLAFLEMAQTFPPGGSPDSRCPIWPRFLRGSHRIFLVIFLTVVLLGFDR